MDLTWTYAIHMIVAFIVGWLVRAYLCKRVVNRLETRMHSCTVGKW